MKKCLVFCILLVVPSLVAAKWVTPEFGDPDARPHKVLILPPHATLRKKKMIKSEEYIAETAALETHASVALQKQLEERGYEVIVLSAEDVNADPALQEMVLRANERYDEEEPKIIRKRKRLKYGRYGVGDTVRPIAVRFGVDAVAFTRLDAVGSGVGQAVFVALVGGSAGTQNYSFAIADAASGQIEGYYVAMTQWGFTQLVEQTPKVMEKMTKLLLKKYPDSGKKIKVRLSKKELAKIEAEEQSESGIIGDEQEVDIAELEALLGEGDEGQQ